MREMKKFLLSLSAVALLAACETGGDVQLGDGKIGTLEIDAKALAAYAVDRVHVWNTLGVNFVTLDPKAVTIAKLGCAEIYATLNLMGQDAVSESVLAWCEPVIAALES